MGETKKQFWRIKRSFSLVELLIVIAIMSVLMSLMFSALSSMSYKSEMVQCQTNLKSIGLALYFYSDDYDEYYPSMDNRHDQGNQTSTGGLQTYIPFRRAGNGQFFQSTLPYFLRKGEVRMNGPDQNGFESAFSCPQVAPKGAIDDPNVPWSHSTGRGYSMPTYYTGLVPYFLYWALRPHDGYSRPMESLRKPGDRWKWDDANARYAQGPAGATSLSFNILASDVLRYGSWYGSGGTQYISNHVKPGQVATPYGGELGGWGTKGWSRHPAYDDSDSNYLFTDNSVRYYDNIPILPDVNSDYLHFRGKSYVPVEMGR